MNIAVLGAGPVGTIACHTIELYGHKPQLIGIGIPSVIRGAQYIHHAINELTPMEPEGMVRYVKRGTREGYALKVYGDEQADCSWDRFEGELPMWNIAAHYTELFDKYFRGMIDTEIRAPMIHDLLEEYDLVFSSITPQGYCEQEHDFEWQTVVLSDENHLDEDLNCIVYSGLEEDPFYRLSNLFGLQQAEYPSREASKRLGHKGNSKTVRKPLGTDCDCFMDNAKFVRMGRYGEFRKNLLVTDAFDTVCEELDSEM